MLNDTTRYRLGLIAPALLLLACVALLALVKPDPDAYNSGAGGMPSNSGADRALMAPPPVEPLILKPVAIEDARAINAEVPFSKATNPPAQPLLFAGDPAARGRATDCLAAAMLYEAGNDPTGQRAVAQVIINRARHPAFPKSICGVVFQGSERSTGCQFTFTCDGAMARRYSDIAWSNARLLAGAALSGSVFASVGHATHYHTDWVVPYWSDSLEKITAVGTHLFFRWPGSWGRPGAYQRGLAGQEANIAKMAVLSSFHRGDGVVDLAALENLELPLPEDEVAIPTEFKPAKREIVNDGGARLVLEKSGRAEEYLALAQAKCAGKSYCKILGWLEDGSIPEVGELGEAGRNSMVFSYLRDEKNGFEKALWNCGIYPRADKRQCMKR